MNEFNEFENVREHHLEFIKNLENTKNILDKSQQTPIYDKEVIKEKIVKQNGELKIVNYIKGKFIGKGGFAKCYEFLNLETNHRSAVKIIDKSTLDKYRSKQKLISEIKIHRSLNNPHIVKFEHFFEDCENVYLLLEICQNQTLNELLKRRKRLTEFEAQYYIYQILIALKCLHSQKIIHRDLKLGNLFIADKMLLKIGDFGLATKMEYEGERKRTLCGTPNYIAPEILEGKNGHSYEVDIWSIGILLYALLVGKPPFESKDVKTTYKKIKSGIFAFPGNFEISEYAKKLIIDILVAEPSRRPSIDQILKSEFFQVGSIPNIMPNSTLACPPNLSFIKHFWPEATENGIAYSPYVKRSISIANPQKAYYIQSEYTRHFSISDSINDNLIEHPGTSMPDRSYAFQSNPINKILSDHKNHKNEVFVVKNGYDEIYVTKWVDYSSKYGIGYLLSNESIGVYFNDSSKIVLDPKGGIFHYIEIKGPNRQEIMTLYTLEEYPDEFKKKVILLHRFKKSLSINDENFNPNLNKNINKYNSTCSKSIAKVKSNEFVYVKKWMMTKNSILFRLSNKIIQVCFFDDTEIILNSRMKEVIYINKEGRRIAYPTSNAMNSNDTEMVKRVKYVKDLLNQMLNQNIASLKLNNQSKLIVQNVNFSYKNIENRKSNKSNTLTKNYKTHEDLLLKEENFWK